MSYRSYADLGGANGHGRVTPEPVGQLFHEPWEREALAITLAMGATGTWNIDMSRSARETLASYPSLTYYELWIAGLERLLVEHGLVSLDELSAGRMLHPAMAVARVLKASDVVAALAKGSPTQRPTTTPARFSVGQSVRTRADEADRHTRLPRYARGRLGHIEGIRGVHVFADTNAHGLGEQPQWLYTVSFSGRELWGTESSADLTVSIDAWESYLEPAT